MKHPTKEEWMSYLYDESPTESREELRAHLKDCAACRAQIEMWQGATRQMNDWQLPRLRKVSRSPAFARWAVAGGARDPDGAGVVTPRSRQLAGAARGSDVGGAGADGVVQ